MSNNIKPTSSTLTQQARAHTVEVIFNKEEVTPLFDRYWDQVKDVLVPHLIEAAKQGGFREVRRDRVVHAAGGLSHFYAPVLVDLIEDHFETQPRQPLLVSNVSCTETITSFVVTGSVHLEPEVRWKAAIPGIDVPLVVDVPKVAPDLADRMVEETLKDVAQRSAVLTPADPESVGADGMVAVINISSMIDGKIWEAGCSTAKKWAIDKRAMKVPELYEALVGSKQGEEKSLTYVLNDLFGDMSGKTVLARLETVQLFNVQVATIDDDLAISNGQENLASFRTVLLAQAKSTIENNRKVIIDSGIYAKLLDLDIVDVDPVPYVWMVEKAKEIYGQARKTVETEAQLLESFRSIKDAHGVQVIKDKSDALTYLATEASKQLITDLVLRSWGLKKGLEGPKSINQLAAYVTLVRKELASLVQTKEVEMGENDATV